MSNSQLIADLRVCGSNEDCHACSRELEDYSCKRHLIADAANALENAQHTIDAQLKIIEALRGNLDELMGRITFCGQCEDRVEYGGRLYCSRLRNMTRVAPDNFCANKHGGKV